MLDIPFLALPFSGALVVALLGQVLRWFPRRVRLTARVERLGTVYALMPESPQKASFNRHLLSAIEELDDWLDLSNVRRRLVVGLVQWGLAIAAIVLLSLPGVLDPAGNPALAFGAGTVAGTAIAAITFLVETVMQRRAKTRDDAAAADRDEALAARRRDAIARGELPEVS